MSKTEHPGGSALPGVPPGRQPLNDAGYGSYKSGGQPLEHNPMATASDQTLIQKEILRDKIFEVLRGWILDGTFKPGQKIVESSLAKKLKVSRAPLREALWLLAQRGLVTLRAHHGAFVTKLSDRDIREIFELRELLETHAAKKVRAAMKADSLEALDRAFERLAAAAQNRDIIEFTAADLEFHRTLWSLSGNRQLEKFLLDLSTRFFGYELIRDLPHSPRFRFDATLEQHRTLLNLIRTGTDEELEAGFREIFCDFLNYVLTRFREQELDAPGGTATEP
jgi:DNA-binding GntR family transcriptional regulator